MGCPSYLRYGDFTTAILPTFHRERQGDGRAKLTLRDNHQMQAVDQPDRKAWQRREDHSPNALCDTGVKVVGHALIARSVELSKHRVSALLKNGQSSLPCELV
jgi:hypothetical protein